MDRKIKTATVITLGCKINTFESLALKEQLAGAGVTLLPDSAGADLCIINTCTVTAKTDAESRRVIRRVKRANPKCVIAVTGCYAQLKPDEISELEGVDYVFDNTAKGGLVEHILNLNDGRRVVASDISKEKSFLNLSPKELDRNRAFLKIQDGCDAFCSYCIVPYARGRSRSLSAKEVIRSVNGFVSAGFKEIVLSGIHIGKYGHDLSHRTDLTSLLKEIERSTDLPRLRISSLEPNEITDEFIDFAQRSKIMCNHLHIPLQSGDAAILKAMKRPYTPREFGAVINRLKNAVSQFTIGADVIVGFPGETEEDFENSYRFIEESRIDYLHVFPFSRREGTPAYSMTGQVDGNVRKKRSRLLRELGERKKAEAYQGALGRKVRVLFEKEPKKDGTLHGLSRGYLNAVTAGFGEDMYNQEREITVREVRSSGGAPVIWVAGQE